MNAFKTVPISRVQEYWDNRPCNIRHSPKPVGTREYFSDVDMRKLLVEPHIGRFADYRRWGRRRVLEVGCGIGTDTFRFACAGADVTAVDLSAESLKLARRRLEQSGRKVSFLQANAEDLSVLGDDRFDLVYSFGVIHHTPNPEIALREMREHLKDDGICKVMVYHRASWKVFKIVKGRFWAIDRLVAAASEAEAGCPVTYSYTKKQVKELFNRSGFQILSVDVDHIFPYRVNRYKEYKYEETLVVRLLPKWIFRRLERRFGWHLMVTARAC